MIIIKNQDQINNIQVAGNILSHLFVILNEYLKEDMTTHDLDKFIHALIIKEGGKPAFLGYNGYSYSSCISINNEIIHGQPSKKRTIKNGDLISIDIGVTYQDNIADSAYTYFLGENPSPEIKKLIESTQLALKKGIEAISANIHLVEISKAIFNIAKENKLGVIQKYCGHGVGVELHEEPEIPNYYPYHGNNPRLRPNMVIAIEPMFTLGSHEIVHAADNFTVLSKDNSLAAHFEHTVLITEKGSKILT